MPDDKAPTPGKRAQILVITDAKDDVFKPSVPAYLEQFLKCEPNKCLLAVDSWKDLVSKLGAYETIDQLIFLPHGIPGSLIIGGEAHSLTELAAFFKGIHTPKITKEIIFDTCSLGEKPLDIIPFARLLQAPKAIAWNYHTYFKLSSVITKKNDDAKLLEEKLERYKGYILLPPGTSITELVKDLLKKPGKHVFLLQWFRLELILGNDDTIEQAPAPGQLDNRSKVIKRRSDAIPKQITSDEAKSLEEEYSKASVPPFNQVIITIVDSVKKK